MSNVAKNLKNTSELVARNHLAEGEINIGLEGIVVGATSISNVEGDLGRLSYRGFDINELANLPFVTVVWLLQTGKMPTDEQTLLLDNWLMKYSALSPGEYRILEQLPRDLHPMLVLQALTPLLSHAVKCEPVPGLDSKLLTGLVISAKLSSVVAYWYQLTTTGVLKEYSPPEQPVALGYGVIHQFLSQIHPNKDIPDSWVKALSTTQILQLEHSFNAGTFAGRVTASTLAPVQSSLAASLGTLFGVLHGGADQAAIEMAIEVGRPENARARVEAILSAGGKIMGMGHREYKVVDPRAKILKPMAKILCEHTEQQVLFETLEAIEETCREVFSTKGKDIWANLEFYKGVVFRALGLPNEFFTATFAMARVYGYVAHFNEFSENTRLIRPQAIYLGRDRD